VTTILVDHNLEGQAAQLSEILVADGWLELAAVRFITLQQAGLLPDSSDRMIWRFAQAHGMLLLTDNRNMKGADSLEQTMREEGTNTSLPVITIGNSVRLKELAYRTGCANRLIEIILDIDIYRGARRLYVP
jgi:hypothetical protein